MGKTYRVDQVRQRIFVIPISVYILNELKFVQNLALVIERIQISDTHLRPALHPKFCHLPKWSQFHLHFVGPTLQSIFSIYLFTVLSSFFFFCFLFLVSRLLVVLLIVSGPPLHPAEWIVNLTLNVFKVGLDSGLELSLIKGLGPLCICPTTSLDCTSLKVTARGSVCIANRRCVVVRDFLCVFNHYSIVYFIMLYF